MIDTILTWGIVGAWVLWHLFLFVFVPIGILSVSASLCKKL